MKTAIIFGATGLVGNHLLNLLIADNFYSKIIVFTRNPYNIVNEKIEIIKIDFDNLDKYSNLIKGDNCFFCIGTTKKETPDNDEYRNIEYNLPVRIGQIAKKNSVNSFIYLSSLGSSINTNNLYLKNKGEAEDALKKLNFLNLSIIRPSLILGSRNKFRPGEFILQKVFKSLSFLFQGPLKKYRAIDANDIAKAMLNISKSNYKNIYFDSDRLQDLAMKV